MKKRICALLLAAVLVYMPYALAAAILPPLTHPAAQGTARAAYEQEAAARGVRVRVLVDGMNARLNLQGSAALQELAAAENVEVRLYNPVDLLRPGEINYRMHD